MELVALSPNPSRSCPGGRNPAGIRSLHLLIRPCHSRCCRDASGLWHTVNDHIVAALGNLREVTCAANVRQIVEKVAFAPPELAEGLLQLDNSAIKRLELGCQRP